MYYLLTLHIGHKLGIIQVYGDSKVDWNKLKQDYKYGEIESVNAFLDNAGIKINGNVSRITTGWRAERDEYRKLLDQQTQDKMVKMTSDNEIEVRARQAKVARYLQTRALKAMESRKVEDVTESQATRLAEIGLREEREALNLNDQGPVINNNITSRAVLMQMPIMKTRYGKALLQMNEEGRMAVLERIHELRALKQNT
ncbi:MAG: hypothetical protein US86_C0002G0069 [Candidatus Daviesbacteria bacterium GW2011_GWA2_38_24]|uniref:Uncharacterized protein n=1 Tax=Candidatus Daviesbacteria bacterium GW2011_GWA2_38_24 TaxID=1618422 RepID=A0A0G0JJC9_9BACT|nr:MAG: hypothetical protein US86_C0002G0069 [Candidatus Daviesbacteria bacterium GW2011_GWA2_38_24]KKQ79970.1 MAG: hypothetical protein UT01_C0023G0009 [Candidatus Daviesbacteria bacterium GW2011_GWA1_38_7]